MAKQTPKSLLGRATRRCHGLLAMNLGRAGSAKPLSNCWGFDRGTAVDRYYIEQFLHDQAAHIKGNVLEVAEDGYSRRFGGNRISRQDIVDFDPANSRATIIGDLADPAVLPQERFDCILLTQTLHLIFDMAAALRQIRRGLRPGGSALITVPGITPLDTGQFRDKWYWSLTGAALERLLCEHFEPDKVNVSVYGNLYSATAFLHGAAVQELSKRKLDRFDPAYPVTVAARAVV